MFHKEMHSYVANGYLDQSPFEEVEKPKSKSNHKYTGLRMNPKQKKLWDLYQSILENKPAERKVNKVLISTLSPKEQQFFNKLIKVSQ